MNDLTVGLALRAIRRRLRLRQVDVGAAAGVSQQLISKIELGRIGRVSHATLRRVFAAVGADVVTVVRWRGGELDRLLDEDHAALVGRVCELLRLRGWEVFPETSYAVYGERGSIDVLAWHAESQTLLVVEIKTQIASAEEMLRRHDTKVRLVPRIAAERLGIQAKRVSRLLVVTDTPTNRRRVARLDAVLRPVYPARGRAVRTWFDDPTSELRGLIFTQPAQRRARPVRRRAIHGRTAAVS